MSAAMIVARAGADTLAAPATAPEEIARRAMRVLGVPPGHDADDPALFAAMTEAARKWGGKRHHRRSKSAVTSYGAIIAMFRALCRGEVLSAAQVEERLLQLGYPPDAPWGNKVPGVLHALYQKGEIVRVSRGRYRLAGPECVYYGQCNSSRCPKHGGLPTVATEPAP